MDKNLRKLIDYIEQLNTEPLHTQLDISIVDEPYQELAKELNELTQNMTEVYKMASNIASGEFTTPMNGYNPFIGPLKEIQSILHHLNWQIVQIANGDYNQSVDYLGDISKSFNDMISKLKNREELLKENTRLTEKILNQKNKLLEYELKHQEEKYEQFFDSVNELRSYRHDMKNHFLCIDALLQDDNNEEARRYIHSLTTIFQSQNKVEYGENYIFGALLNEKLTYAEKMNVTVTKKIRLNRKLKIDNKDWCTLFGNALDNSLEALEKVEEENRTLDIIVKNVNDMLIVKITNTMVGKLLRKGKRFETTKEDEYIHGLGLINIKKSVEKYKGEMKIKVEDHKFILVFILFRV